MKVSLYKKYNSVAVLKNVQVLKVLDEIGTGVYAEEIKQVRFYINDKPSRDLAKQKLPLIGFGGMFTARANRNLKESSGLACLDYDNLPNVLETKKLVNADKYTFASFISPSGDGLNF